MANLRVDKITSTETFEKTGSVQFDGDADYLEASNSDDFQLGTGDFTVEAWVLANDNSGSRQIISMSDGTENWQLFTHSGGTIRWNSRGTNDSGTIQHDADAKIDAKIWNHVAATRSGNTLRLFKNGIVVGTFGYNSDLTLSAGGPSIGIWDADKTSEDWNGHISNLRIVKGTALYTSNFKPSMRELEVIPGTVLLACQSKTDATLEKTGKTLTVGGNAVANELTPGILTPVVKSGGGSAITGSVEFDGTGDYLTIPNTEDLRLADSDFTIEFWATISKVDSTYSPFALFENSSALRSYQLEVRSNGAVRFEWWYNGSSGNDITTGTGAVIVNEWYHYAVSRNGATLKLFINGIEVGSSDVGTNSFFNNTVTPFIIGGMFQSGVHQQKWQGNISNFRINKGTALYTDSFTPPTRELKRVPGTVLLCCQDENSVTTEVTGKTITGYGDLQRADDVELITNGSFAGDFTGWTNGNPSQFTYSTDSVGGDTSGKLKYVAADSNLRTFTQYVTCVTGQKYNLSFVASSNASNAMVIDIDGTNVVTIDNNSNANLVRYNHVFTAGSTSVRIRVESAASNTSYFDNFSVTLVDGSNKGSNFTPQVGDDRQVTFEGVTKINTDAYFYLPTGDTITRDSRSGRGLFAGGDPGNKNNIDFITIASMGNGFDFGDLTAPRLGTGAVASSTRAVFMSGYSNPGSAGNVNTIDFVTIATTANAIDFGNLDADDRHENAAVSNQTRGMIGGGSGSSDSDSINYITIASTGDSLDFGNLTLGRRNATGVMSPTRGVFCGGRNETPAPSTQQEEMDYVTIASTGNALDFGDLTVARGRVGSVCSSVRGVVGGGEGSPANSNVIDYITIASTGNAVDFGILIGISLIDSGGCSNQIRGVFGGVISPNAGMNYVTIATTGDANDFGDLSYGATRKSGCSDSHGGLG